MAATRMGPGARHLGVRAVVVVGAYGATSAVVLLAIVLLRRAVSPDLLRGVLSFFFIAALAAGLEPATVKAQVLRGEALGVSVAAYLGAGALKALAVSPFLALVWRFADPHMEVRAFLWLPLVTIIGFAATDLRVLLDVRGRHAQAIWLKQGALAGGLVVLAGLTAAGLPLFWAIGASTLARLAFVGFAAVMTVEERRPKTLWPPMKALLADPRWVDLAAASAIAAAGGSVDRVLALRFLPAAAFGGYLLLYETFSRFWLVPYLLTPILFARRASGQDAGPFIRGAWLATLAAGGLFVLAVAAVMLLAPDLPRRLLGTTFGPATLAFALAVVIGAFTQLRVAELQASGAARRATLAMGLSAAIAAVLFLVFIMRLGAPGLLWAWLVKSVVELVATLVGGRRGLRRQPV